jgi:SAM-dependent methyltransferase
MTDRRTSVPFDPEYFARRAAEGERLAPLEAFRHAWRSNFWCGPESQSGQGSSLDQTARIREALPRILERHAVRTLLDLPCGDCHWIARTPLPGVEYIGGDLVPEIVAGNAARFADSGRRFLQLDLTRSPLPSADLLLCRDALVHLSIADIMAAIGNLRRAEIRYLLTTTFTSEPENRDITTGDWRPINLELAPFGFPPPIETLNEGCTEGEGRFADKSLALWRIADLPSR